MVDKEWIFVLGAQDPEMGEIERTLQRVGQPFVHAATGGGRCLPRTAYEADDVVRVSRAGQAMPATLPAMAPTAGQRLLAAADHCLTAAYQGACPGVDPHDLLIRRASWQAKMSGRTLGDMMEGIQDAARWVERHYDSELGEAVFLDSAEVPLDLAEGAALAGKLVRYRQLLPDGELKEMLMGAGPDHIEMFMAAHRAAGRQVYGNPYRGYAGAYR